MRLTSFERLATRKRSEPQMRQRRVSELSRNTQLSRVTKGGLRLETALPLLGGSPLLSNSYFQLRKPKTEVRPLIFQPAGEKLYGINGIIFT